MMYGRPNKRGPKPRLIRTCAVVGCTARAHKNNPYCPLHTLRAQRHGGDPTICQKPRKKATA